MDFGALLERAWNIVWDNKWLIILGIIVALGSGNSGGGSGFNFSSDDFGNFNQDTQPGQPDFDFDDFDFEGFPNSDEFEEIFPFLGVAAGLLIVLLCVVFIIGIAFWVASRIAAGGLIAGVSIIDGGGVSSFTQAWQAGWARGWQLIGAGLIPLLPMIVMLVAVGGLIASIGGIASLDAPRSTAAAGGGIAIAFISLLCVTVLATIILSLFSTLADRAVVLEEAGVFEAYGRAWIVLQENLGPALILFLIHMAISVMLGIALFLPSIILTLCCILWPILLIIQGTITTYFSTLWTLAWRQWTGAASASLEAPLAPAPAE